MSDSEAEALSPLILYATETGTAEDVANKIARHCRRIQLCCRIENIENYPLHNVISEDLIIFVISTTGSGHPPRSLLPFFKDMLFRSTLPLDLFSDLHFAIFGLGDSGYEKFCWPAKLLRRRLKGLGASEIVGRRGEGDERDMSGIDGALLPWIEDLLKVLQDMHELPDDQSILPPTALPEPRVALFEGSSQSNQETVPSGHWATLRVNHRVTTKDWWQDVRHCEFDMDVEIQYEPGDIAVLRPEPPEDNVQSFLNLMGWANDADVSYRIERKLYDQTFPCRLPAVLTLRQIFTRVLDFNVVPKRSFFEFLRHFVQDEMEIEKIAEWLDTPDGAEDLYDYAFKPRRTIWEVLAEFRSAKIPKDYIFDVFPPLRDREFSIASSVKKHQKQIHLCIAIVRYKTSLKIPRTGLCTSYLSRLQPGARIRIGIRKGLLKLPSDLKTPVVCVGPGTGIAPMRAVIEERIVQGSSDNTLYFGCRSAHKDFYYESEWRSYVSDGQDSKLVLRTAFSRDAVEGAKRPYVQDLMKEDGKRLWELLGENEGFLFVSGSSNKMPAAVREAVKEAAIRFGSFSAGKEGQENESVEEWMKTLEQEGRFVEECWS